VPPARPIYIIIIVLLSCRRNHATSGRGEKARRPCARAAGFPRLRRPRNVRAAHGVADVSSGGFYDFHSRRPTTSARAGIPDRYRSGRFLRSAVGCVAYAARPDRPDYPRTGPENSDRPHPRLSVFATRMSDDPPPTNDAANRPLSCFCVRSLKHPVQNVYYYHYGSW